MIYFLNVHWNTFKNTVTIKLSICLIYQWLGNIWKYFPLCSNICTLLSYSYLSSSPSNSYITDSQMQDIYHVLLNTRGHQQASGVRYAVHTQQIKGNLKLLIVFPSGIDVRNRGQQCSALSVLQLKSSEKQILCICMLCCLVSFPS